MNAGAGILMGAVLTSSLAVAASSRLTFTKSFPGSIPAYESVIVTREGAIEYREAPNEENPVTATLSPAQKDLLFSLAEKLQYFKQPLESGLKVANTGKKSFGYDDGNGAVTEAMFNYSTQIPAQQLLDQMEQIAATERAYIDLDRTVHFDKLGVNDSLAQVESLWLRKQLSAPEQFTSLLNYISRHESFMHLVRERAARLKDNFVAPVSVIPEPDSPQGK